MHNQTFFSCIHNNYNSYQKCHAFPHPFKSYLSISTKGVIFRHAFQASNFFWWGNWNHCWDHINSTCHYLVERLMANEKKKCHWKLKMSRAFQTKALKMNASMWKHECCFSSPSDNMYNFYSTPLSMCGLINKHIIYACTH